MPWQPSFPGEVPTLGFHLIDWIHHYLARPDNAGVYEPIKLYLEQEDFILRWYELDPETGARKYARGVLNRGRGWGKSPILAALGIVEALAPVVFDGWDADGQPVGRPWHTLHTPKVSVAAVSEDQVENTWSPLVEMLHEDCPIYDDFPGVEPMEGNIIIPFGRGRIERLTSSGRTNKGKGSLFTIMDQTEEWVPSNGGTHLAKVLRSNTAKMGGTLLESPNAFIPGDGSVAEGSAAYHDLIVAGRAKDESLYYDARSAPANTDIRDRKSLMHGLRVAYGDSSGHPDGCLLHDPPCAPGHVNLDRLITTIWDPETDIATTRSDFLNQSDAASDSWVSRTEWESNYDPDEYMPITDGDKIVLGFDGSAGRIKGKADATALVAMRVSDGFTWPIGIWEAKQGEEEEYVAPVMEVNAAVDRAHERFNVIGFFGDPNGWTEPMQRWTRKYGRRYTVKASHNSPIAAWPTGRRSRVEGWVEALRRAIALCEVPHNGDPHLTAHVLNARRRTTRSGYLLYKKYPSSPNKIDGAYALMLAYRARMEALGKNINTDNKRTTKKKGRVTVS